MPVGFNSDFRTSERDKIKIGIDNAYQTQWLAGATKAPSIHMTKYSRYGERAEGVASLLDTAIIQRNIEREQKNLGEGYVQLQIPDGKDKDRPINIGGRLHYADKNGVFTIIDEKYLEIMKQRETEKREYIEGLIQTAIMSDEVCAVLLGTDEAGLATKLGPNSGDEYGVDATSDLYKVDARPSAIETYAETSQAYSLAVQKFKLALKARAPIISPMTNDKTLHAD